MIFLSCQILQCFLETPKKLAGTECTVPTPDFNFTCDDDSRVLTGTFSVKHNYKKEHKFLIKGTYAPHNNNMNILLSIHTAHLFIGHMQWRKYRFCVSKTIFEYEK